MVVSRQRRSRSIGSLSALDEVIVSATSELGDARTRASRRSVIVLADAVLVVMSGVLAATGRHGAWPCAIVACVDLLYTAQAWHAVLVGVAIAPAVAFLVISHSTTMTVYLIAIGATAAWGAAQHCRSIPGQPLQGDLALAIAWAWIALYCGVSLHEFASMHALTRTCLVSMSTSAAVLAVLRAV
ncbi:Uncharacterized protein PBTT_03118 [Plasmodiophora brassicae]|uniref:Uncharacterized protein n=1 Tax=Plasmodiophora brassicae TaxID=37360 RepID=A0A3P3Y5Q2_PLABS|nr:unnamed protein product [Plasmodiophora brassicae]